MKAVTPIFSGDVDPLINQLDFQKIKARLSSQQGKATLNDREVTLIEDFLSKRKQLDRKMILTGLWDSIVPRSYNTTSSTPDSREGAAGCLVGSDLFLFGGFARGLFGDFRQFEAVDRRWTILKPAQPDKEKPTARFGHSMVAYNDRKLVLFGGASAYLEAIKMRLCLDDLFLYDVVE